MWWELSSSEGLRIEHAELRTLSIDQIGDLIERLPLKKLSRLVERLNEIVG